ncbi:MAG: ABC-2 transporter permease [Pseudomonadota bacterium]
MIARFPMLVRREFWEHRSLIVAPLVVAGLILLGALIPLVFGLAQEGLGAKGMVAWLNFVPSGGTSTGINGLLLAPFGFMNLVLFFTVFFYCLDALYAERKDRSVLFWRSLPVTDTETVIAKFLTASVAAPIVVFVVLSVLQVAFLIVATLVVWMGDGDAGRLIWAPLQIGQVITLSAYLLFAGSVLLLPFVGWFLLCSAFVRKTPFLWAVLPFVLIPLLEGLIFRSQHFIEIVYGHFPRAYASSITVDTDMLPNEDEPFRGIDLTGLIDFGGLLSSVSTWGGIVVAVAFGAAAVYVRRYRTEADS